MGAWGSGNLENDDAQDWLEEFCAEPDPELIWDALSIVAEMDDGEYLEAPDCCVGLVAAEVVACLKGASNPHMTDSVKECIAQLHIKDDSGLVALALSAVARIKTESELKELWDESDNPPEWYEAVSNLEERLKQ